MLRFAAQLGHRIVPPRPALVPLTTNLPWVAELRGITIGDVSMRILEQDQTLAQQRFTALRPLRTVRPGDSRVSRVVSGHPQPQTLVLEIDLLPGTPLAELDGWLRGESLADGQEATWRSSWPSACRGGWAKSCSNRPG